MKSNLVRALRRIVLGFSPETFAWVKLFTESTFNSRYLEDDEDPGYKARKKFTPDIETELLPYRMKKTSILYRGLAFIDVDDYLGDMGFNNVEDDNYGEFHSEHFLNLGDEFKASDNSEEVLTSWSKELSIAKRFAGRKFGFVVSATVNPNQTVLDTDELSKDLCGEDKLKLACKEREVIVKGEVSGQVIFMQSSGVEIRSIDEIKSSEMINMILKSLNQADA